MASELPTYVLTISCPDRIGLIADVAGFLVANDCNIIESGQFNDAENGQFFMRNVFQPPVSAWNCIQFTVGARPTKLNSCSE